MKLKTSILLTIIFSISATAFGQKETVKPITEAKPITDSKLTGMKPAAVKIPTAQEILAKYVQAIGGREANEKIKSRMIKGTQEIPAANLKGTFEILTAAPNKVSSKAALPGLGEFTDGFDGQTLWSNNPVQGSRDKQGEELAQGKISYDFYREINLDKLYPKMEVKGIEKVGASDAYVVVGTPANLPPETFYFDTKSGLLLRKDSTVISPEGKQSITSFLEDYRDVDGVKVAFKSRTILPQFEIITIITEVKNNVAVEDAKFAKPKA